jgi:large subunit ribosomal protein L19
LEQSQLKADLPDVQPGDTVRVRNRVVEGDQDRVQVFEGTVIAVQKGGTNARFTVRRIAAHGIGVERTFLFHSPRVEEVEVVRRSHVRRAKLYYLRERRGRKARLRERRR